MFSHGCIPRESSFTTTPMQTSHQERDDPTKAGRPKVHKLGSFPTRTEKLLDVQRI